VSLYLKAHRAEYYDRLQAVRTSGDWAGWFRFFLTAVIDVAQRAADTARAILDLRERMRLKVTKANRRTASLHRALDDLFLQPITTASLLSMRLAVSYQTANLIIGDLIALRILREKTGHRRNRQFEFRAYVLLFETGA
jgi:Fic family protein